MFGHADLHSESPRHSVKLFTDIYVCSRMNIQCFLDHETVCDFAWPNTKPRSGPILDFDPFWEQTYPLVIKHGDGKNQVIDYS